MRNLQRRHTIKLQKKDEDDVKKIQSSGKKDLNNDLKPPKLQLKVDPICHNSLKLGNILSSAMTPRFVLLRFNNSIGKKYNAFSPPHTINVQLAPCQNPLTRNIMKVFLTFIHVPPLLPPRGMYR